MAAQICRTRAFHIGLVTKAENKINPVLAKAVCDLSDEDLTQLDAASQHIPDKQSKISELDEKLIDALESDDEVGEKLPKIDDIEFPIRLLLYKIQRYIDAGKDLPDDNSSNHITHTPGIRGNMRWPKIDSPKFSGDYKEWMPFFDMFNGTVHSNNRLPKARNLHYLKAYLKGEPAKMLSNLPTTDANYDNAVKMLKDRYEDKKMITRAHLSGIFKYAGTKSDSPQDLRKLVNNFTESSWALEALNIGEALLNQIWIFQVSEKLDPESRKQWGISEAAIDGTATIEDLVKFIETLASALEAAGSSSSAKPKEKDQTKPIQSYPTTPGKSSACLVCNGNHRVHDCQKFKGSEVEARRQSARELKIVLPNQHARRARKSTTLYSKPRQTPLVFKMRKTTFREVRGALLVSCFQRTGLMSRILTTSSCLLEFCWIAVLNAASLPNPVLNVWV